MSAQRILTLLAFAAAVPSSQTSDCSFSSLVEHLNLTNPVLFNTRPVKHWTTNTPVYLDMLLYGILGVDEKPQTVTSHVWLMMTWKNEFLTWNSSNFCGIKTLTIPMSKLWVPDIIIQEDASDTGSVYTGPLARLSHDGLVFSASRQRLTSTCHMALKLFPFDKQSCNITFGSMTSEGISLGTFSGDAVLTKMSEQYMVTQGEWELEGMEILKSNTTNKDSVESRLVYMVTITRKPMLYVINLIIPLLFFLNLDLASFFISEARGEKLSFKITILLSISVLLLILKDMLPSSEKQLPMIANYCLSIFALVGLSVLEAMLAMFLTDLDASCLTKTQRSDGGKQKVQLNSDQDKEAAAEGQLSPEKVVLPDASIDLLRRILQEVTAARQEAASQNKDKSESGRYRRLAAMLDRVFFALYLLAVVVFLAYMYTEWLHTYIQSSG